MIRSKLKQLQASALFLSAIACGSQAEEMGESDWQQLSREPVRDSLGQELGGLVSLAVQLNRGTEEQLNLVARIRTGADSVLEFYEPEPGGLMVSGAGQSSDEVEGLGSNPSPRDLWDAYSNGASMPETLSEAIERQGSAEAGSGGSTGPESEKRKQESAGGKQWYDSALTKRADVGTMTQAVVGGYCDTEYFTRHVAGWGGSALGMCFTPFDHIDCVNDWTGGRVNHTYSDVHSLWANACAKIGTVVLQVSRWGGGSGTSGLYTWTVPEDTARWYHWTSFNCDDFLYPDCPNAGASVSDATNDVFHARYFASSY